MLADRALSFIQPWLSGGILRFGKRIENRVGWRACEYRGPIWLHASLQRNARFDEGAEGLCNALLAQDRDEEWDDYQRTHLEAYRVRGDVRWKPGALMPLGAIVGHAKIVHVIRGESDWHAWWTSGATAQARADRVSQRGWWFGGFALVLADVVEIEPVPAKGALGLWKVPEQIAADARAALREAEVRRG